MIKENISAYLVKLTLQDPKTSSSLHSVDKNLRKELLEKEKKDLETEREEKKKIAGPSTAKRLKYIKNRIKDINRQLDTELHARLRERNHLNYLRRLEKKKKHRIIMENSSEDIMVSCLVTCFVPSLVISFLFSCVLRRTGSPVGRGATWFQISCVGAFC
jgi:hypothetical protein